MLKPKADRPNDSDAYAENFLCYGEMMDYQVLLPDNINIETSVNRLFNEILPAVLTELEKLARFKMLPG